MSFLKRMFSADYRRAIAAEAAGDYTEAARAYALAGEHAKVAEMHLLRAERSGSPESKLQELRAAVRWAAPEEADGRAARRRIARALLEWARASGLISDADRQVVREAAALFAESGDHAGAGECHELVGDEMAAADAYQRAGDVERLESVLSREESRRKRSLHVADAFDEYKLLLAGGDRDLALAALRTCVDSAPDAEKAAFRRTLEELERRLLTAATVVLREGKSDVRYVGAFPVVLGREPVCHVVLRDAGISRRHAELVSVEAGFAVRDLESKNGTTLAGVRIAGMLPLGGAGEIGLGEHCVLGYEVHGARVDLQAVRGVDRGLTIVASGVPIALGAADLHFVDGRPRLTASHALILNGVHAGGAVQLIQGDVVELGERRLEVV
jgi:pSer/pThr/pTyr-binding forkhead associated (FHA) protein